MPNENSADIEVEILEHPAGETVPPADHNDDDDDDDDHDGAGGEEASTRNDAEVATDGFDEDRAAIRERRRKERAERKQKAKEREASLQRKLEASERANQDLAQRLSVIERKTAGGEVAQLDGYAAQVNQAIVMWESKLVEASTKNDIAGAVQAGQNVTAAKAELARVKSIKDGFVKQQSAPAPLNPNLVAHATAFLKEHPWINPTGTDVDNRIVRAVDEDLHRSGWDPAQPEYFEELGKRLKEKLPSRFTAPKSNNYNNDKPRQRSVVTGSGRESSATTVSTIKLSQERVQAMKDAGVWEDPKARDDAIKRYRAHDRETQTDR